MSDPTDAVEDLDEVIDELSNVLYGLKTIRYMIEECTREDFELQDNRDELARNLVETRERANFLVEKLPRTVLNTVSALKPLV
jgi:regulator of replication initiation timing